MNRNLPVVSVSWLRDNLHDPDLIILDASIPKAGSDRKSEYLGQRIAGARFFDLKGRFSDQECELPNMLPDPETFARECRNLGINRNSKIVVYDNLGIYSSPRVWWMFQVMGHDAVAVLDGGLPEWVRKAYEIEETIAISYPQGNFEANHQPYLVKNGDDIASNLKSSEAVVIDARSPGRFGGTAPEPRESLRSGHIPRSLNLYYNQVLRDGKFLPMEELAEVIGKLNLGSKPLIFTCGSGITACIIMLACTLVTENEKAVYDGSWSEWGLARNNLPIEK